MLMAKQNCRRPRSIRDLAHIVLILAIAMTSQLLGFARKELLIATSAGENIRRETNHFFSIRLECGMKAGL